MSEQLNEASLSAALRQLRRRAGEPSARRIAQKINFSRTTVAKAFASSGCPSWEVVRAIVLYLEGDLIQFRPLWVAAMEVYRPLGAAEHQSAVPQQYSLGMGSAIAAPVDSSVAAYRETFSRFLNAILKAGDAHVGLRRQVLALLATYLREPAESPAVKYADDTGIIRRRPRPSTAPRDFVASDAPFVDWERSAGVEVGSLSGALDWEVRQAIQTLVCQRLRPYRAGTDQPNPLYWDGISLDLSSTLLLDFDMRFTELRRLNLSGATIHGDCRFDAASIRDGANFTGTRFEGGVGFDECNFYGPASFDAAAFGGPARFDWVRFHKSAMFRQVTFSDEAHFEWSKFLGKALFGGILLSQPNGVATTFSSSAQFQGADFRQDAYFNHVVFRDGAHFKDVDFFTTASFKGARFHGKGGLDRARVRNQYLFGGQAFVGAQAFRDDFYRVMSPPCDWELRPIPATDGSFDLVFNPSADGSTQSRMAIPRSAFQSGRQH